MIENLESCGLVNYQMIVSPLVSNVSLRANEDEVVAALRDKVLLGGILNDKSCIVK